MQSAIFFICEPLKEWAALMGVKFDGSDQLLTLLVLYPATFQCKMETQIGPEWTSFASSNTPFNCSFQLELQSFRMNKKIVFYHFWLCYFFVVWLVWGNALNYMLFDNNHDKSTVYGC